ncbi:MAG: hypothetical protein MN733_03310 [Nitrososphaera sp.]|nr:hypothetical protein [Nitrososphaera sp.]
MKKLHDLVDIEVLVMHETDKAWLLHDGKKEAWFPKAQIELNHEGRKEDDYVIATMPEWLALEKGFI